MKLNRARLGVRLMNTEQSGARPLFDPLFSLLFPPLQSTYGMVS